MSSWLVTKAPVRFDELLYPESIRSTIERTAVQANPPHLLLSGASGVGKTATWRLIARQVLGPSWNARTHVLQARDLARTSGAMSKFEEFLRPEGASSSDTLAGRTSLDAYDASFSGIISTTPAPAGKESTPELNEGRAPVSRLIVIEDADYLGTIRQSYLRRMMESASGSARFIFTSHTPSRVIEALRSRTQHIRLPSPSRKDIEACIAAIAEQEGIETARGVLGDIAHIANGNLRKAIFVTELLGHRSMLTDRKNLQHLIAATSVREMQHVLEEALRNRVHDWRWEKKGMKNSRVLKGAMGSLDQAMGENNLEPEDVVVHFHRLLTAGRMQLEEHMLAELLVELANCDVALHKTTQGRIELERFLLKVAQISERHAQAKAS
ncbi:MAG TPA: AAA family ATPase [Candidatus Poseidoniaceae archaeon]|nr:MAG TPA: AAA family ATPase [Candidatus Poseidoniales archaeon]HII11280.1 AAA family ATPase [Candidatus Poseidoniaceae archaeon]